MRLFRRTLFLPNSPTHIHDKTEGHPLFATNLLQYLQERADIAKTNEHLVFEPADFRDGAGIAGECAQHD